jgi:SAM-dependent methyltransferase
MSVDPAALNNSFWQTGQHVRLYANRQLAPVEVILLARFREAFCGRVVEIGSGAGRVLGYLSELSDQACGIDLSQTMVDYCRREFPGTDVRLGDMAKLGEVFDGRFDVIFATNNVLDVYDDGERREVIGSYRSLLSPGGLLIFSTHNLGELDRPGIDGADRDQAGRAAALTRMLLDKSARQLVSAARRLPTRTRNRRRLAPMQRRGDGYAILNDSTFDYGLLHYFITREAQVQQLTELGYELVDCLDREGRTFPEGATGGGPWLHYVARAVG